MAVELHAAVEEVAEVPEQLEIAVHVGRTPDLRRVLDVPVARRDQIRHVAALHAAVGGRGAPVFQAQVPEAGGPEREPDVSGEVPGLAVPRLALDPAQEFDAAPGAVVAQQEVDDPGDGVRAVLGRRAVAQHLDPAERDGRNCREIRPLRAERDAVSPVPVNDRRAVPAFAVDEDERVVGRQVAQHRRPHERGGVADRLDVDGERRDDRAEPLVDGGRPLVQEVLGADGVDRRRRLDHRAGRGAGADDDDLFGKARRLRFRFGRGRVAGFLLFRRRLRICPSLFRRPGRLAGGRGPRVRSEPRQRDQDGRDPGGAAAVCAGPPRHRMPGSGASGAPRWPDSMNAMIPKSAPHEWKGSLERRSSSPVPVIEEMFSLT